MNKNTKRKISSFLAMLVTVSHLTPTFAQYRIDRSVEDEPFGLKVESFECTPQPSRGQESTYTAKLVYRVPRTDERVMVDLHLIDAERAEDSILIADFFRGDGNLVATLETSGEHGQYEITDYGRELEPEIILSFMEALGDEKVLRDLGPCVAEAKWWKKLVKALCIVAAGICCAVSAPACPACSTGAGICVGALD